MKNGLLPLLLVTALLASAPQAANAALPAMVDEQALPSLAPMLDRVTPAVVNISTVNHIRMEDHPLLRDPFFRRFFDLPDPRQRRRENQSLGTGVIVDAQRGYLLTNHHVIDKADEIVVRLHDGRKLTAELLGADPETDVAVLRIEATDLTALEYADSDRLRVGDFVVAIGNPFGLSQTVTSGIVSALGRSGLGIEGYEHFIQTDASINPGNSGGPLVNLRGELVGINTAIYAPGGGNVGIGFAIPTNMVRAIMDQIVEHGAVQRGVFGIGLQDLTPELAAALKIERRQGALVAQVQENSAADKAGLKTGDLIIALDDRPVGGAAELRTRLALLRVGDPIKLDILRDGQARIIEAQIADPYAQFTDGGQISAQLSGAPLGEVEDDSPFGKHSGIAVGPVVQDSRAWRIGLRSGDVIFEVNRTRVESLADLKQAIAPDSGIWRIKLRREAQIITLVSR